MTIETLLNHSFQPLSIDATAGQALARMAEYGVRHLPVVDAEERLAGMVSEDQMLNAFDHEAPVQAALVAAPTFATLQMHPFQVARLMADHHLSLLPVVEEGNHFVGVIQRGDLFDQLTHMFSVNTSGAVLVLAVEERDYSLGQLAHLVEQNDAKVLSAAAGSKGGGVLEVTLKLNVQDTSRVRHILEHHGYRVVAAFSKDNSPEDLLNRVQEFLRYLDL